MLVPVFGLMGVTARNTSEPTTEPIVMATNDAHQPSPKAIGKAPKSMLPYPNWGPKKMVKSSRGFDLRSMCGIMSIPRVSILPKLSFASPARTAAPASRFFTCPSSWW